MMRPEYNTIKSSESTFRIPVSIECLETKEDTTDGPLVGLTQAIKVSGNEATELSEESLTNVLTVYVLANLTYTETSRTYNIETTYGTTTEIIIDPTKTF